MPDAEFDPQASVLVACRRLWDAMNVFDDVACRRLCIGRSDLRALNLLETGPLNSAVIAERLGLTRGSVTALVDRLEAAGYVLRQSAPYDRRSILVGLQPETWRALAEVYQPLGRRVHAIAADMSDPELGVVLDTLERMRAAFEPGVADRA